MKAQPVAYCTQEQALSVLGEGADKLMYRIFVDDNFHYMDDEYRYQKGTYDEWESAVAVCKGIVDRFLIDNYKEGMTADELWKQYSWFGEDPFVVGPEPDSTPFSAWTYAKERCKEICGETPPS